MKLNQSIIHDKPRYFQNMLEFRLAALVIMNNIFTGGISCLSKRSADGSLLLQEGEVLHVS